ncbi:Uncharacterized protein APZ42_016471 [Daphnia magna]|uniref:C-type lectin domain-containing protein n=1 Tax=Daphnia magna TaxID=35525 RepID=A0A165AFL5_9CRUS|nr:Uncharacterized protein APZ42_016471 [Daphnia magna]
MFFCYQNGMKLVSLESYEEEQAILSAWDLLQWSSLSDVKHEGFWIWEGTGTPLLPGYENWNDGEPNGSSASEQDCMSFPTTSQIGWIDNICDGDVLPGTCELHP